MAWSHLLARGAQDVVFSHAFAVLEAGAVRREHCAFQGNALQLEMLTRTSVSGDKWQSTDTVVISLSKSSFFLPNQ
uniref:Uncharacterized protein n=1 Tax=Anopheles dirus TaxID=7168 RepID=A0A182NVX9_9DIPT